MSSSAIPERENLALASRIVDRSMESDEDHFLNNKQKDK